MGKNAARKAVTLASMILVCLLMDAGVCDPGTYANANASNVICTDTDSCQCD